MEQPTLIRLLLVGDDHAFAARLLRALEGAQPGSMQLAGTVSGAEEAGAHIAAAHPDVVLLDLAAGGAQALARVAAACTAPILALAARGDAAERTRAVRLGARGVVLKGDTPELIRKALRKVKEGELWLDRRTTAMLLRELLPASLAIDAAAHGRIAKLTARQQEIVRALVCGDGAGGRELAARLGMSEQTLRNHFSAIYRKLGIANRVGLVAYATRLRASAD